MTQAEKVVATEDVMQDLRDYHDNKTLATHNMSISSFHDMCITLNFITHEMILISVWGDIEHLQQSFVYVTDETMANYFHMLTQFGLVSNYKELFLALKKETVSLIHQKLCEVAWTPVVKMFYANFNNQITAKLGVVIVNWPLKKFQSPSNVGSMMELKLLYNAWKTGTLMQLEWEEWVNACFEVHMAELQSYQDTMPARTTGCHPTMLQLPSELSQWQLSVSLTTSFSQSHEQGASPTVMLFRVSTMQTPLNCGGSQAIVNFWSQELMGGVSW
ncbi:hypothetical protein V8B97DRAFT_2026059 [Scleroderma yunnanense]